MDSNKGKIRLIKEINELLTSHDRPQLTPDDFNILWDMDIDELYEVLNEIHRQFEPSLP